MRAGVRVFARARTGLRGGAACWQVRAAAAASDAKYFASYEDLSVHELMLRDRCLPPRPRRAEKLPFQQTVPPLVQQHAARKYSG